MKWRTIAAVSAICPILSIIALFFVPESPHWLMTKGRLVEAQASLAWLRGWVSVRQVKTEYEEIYDLLVRQPAQVVAETTTNQSSCGQTIARYQKKSFLKPYALITLTFFIGHFSGKTTLQTYAVQVRKCCHWSCQILYYIFPFRLDLPHSQSPNRQILRNNSPRSG